MTVRLDNFFKVFKVVISKQLNLTFIIHENNDSFYYKKNSAECINAITKAYSPAKNLQIEKVLHFLKNQNIVYIFCGIFDSVTNL